MNLLTYLRECHPRRSIKASINYNRLSEILYHSKVDHTGLKVMHDEKIYTLYPPDDFSRVALIDEQGEYANFSINLTKIFVVSRPVQDDSLLLDSL